MLSCKEASRLISQSLDRQLTMRERLSLRFHLLLCDMCTTFRRQLGLIRVAVRRYKTHMENNESIRLSEEARVRISRSLQAD